MDDFIFIAQRPQTKRGMADRQLIRAHVARLSWQELKARGNHCLHSTEPRVKGSSRASAHILDRTSMVSSKVTPHGNDMTSGKQHLSVAPFYQFGCICDAFVYAGVSVSPSSCRFFQHYAGEFKILLCNDVQPFYVDGPAICCSSAIQTNSPALLHAICFQAAAHEAVVSASLPLRTNMFQDLSSGTSMELTALYHKSRALACLRDIVEGADTRLIGAESTILCTAILLGAEAMMGDLTSLRSHAYGLTRIVRVSGGLETLSNSTRRLIQFTGVKAAHVLRSSPVFGNSAITKARARRWEVSLKAASLLAKGRDLAKCGQGFSTTTLQAEFRRSLLSCIGLTKSLVLSVAGKRHCRHISDRHISEERMDDFIILESTLATLRNRNDLSAVEKCLCLAMLLFVNTALWQIPLFFNWIKILAADLREAILQLDWTASVRDWPGFLLWMAFLGRQGACAGSIGGTRWWSDKIRLIAMESNIQTFPDAERELRCYFYIEEAYHLAWDSVWEREVRSGGRRGEEAPGWAVLASVTTQKHPCDQELPEERG